MNRRPIHIVRAPVVSTGWRRMVILSLVLHLVGFGGAIGLPRLISRDAPSTPVYVVDLVSLPAPAPKRKQPGGGSRGTKKITPVPTPPPREEKVIKIPDPDKPKPPPKKEKPRPAPKPKPEKEIPEPEKIEEPLAKIEKPAEPDQANPGPREDAAADAGAVADPVERTAPGSTIGGRGTAAIGVPGGTGDFGGDARTFYYTLLKMRIEGSWHRPIYPPNYSDRRTLVVTVRLGLSSSGRVTSLDLLTPSGYAALDRSILRAVRDAEPFPPFPPQMTRSRMAIQIEFVFNPD